MCGKAKFIISQYTIIFHRYVSTILSSHQSQKYNYLIQTKIKLTYLKDHLNFDFQ